MNPLEEATTDELIAEISRRAEAGVVVLTVDEPTDDGRAAQITKTRFFGSDILCLGMVEFAKNSLVRDIEERLTGEPD
jgi:hypothetical protein